MCGVRYVKIFNLYNDNAIRFLCFSVLWWTKVQLLWDQGEVDECEFRGMVSSYSMWGGIAAQSVGEEQAKTKVRNEAAEMGATHVVLGEASGGYFGGKTDGRAYFCEE